MFIAIYIYRQVLTAYTRYHNQPKINVYKVILMGTVNIVVALVAISLLKNVYGVVIATLCTTIAGLLLATSICVNI